MPKQKLFTEDVLRRLAANGLATAPLKGGPAEPDHFPVVKIFNPYGAATWLLSESDPEEPDRLYGLCDLGFGSPELGYVSRREIEHTFVILGRCELPLERDASFRARWPLSRYADCARKAQRIVEDCSARATGVPEEAR